MTAQPILVFDIETVPDLETGKRLYTELQGLSDDNALMALMAIREGEAGNAFMKLPLHKIACLSFLWVDLEKGKFSLKSLSLNEYSEKEILTTFFRAFDKTPMPILVSWNGTGFDIPVILYRAMHHKLSAPRLFNDNGKNSYTSRYGNMNMDVMDKLSLHNYAYKQSLNTVSALCGIAGKGDTDGSQVVPMVKNGEWEKLTTYCESDVLNTWLIYLRHQLLLGKINLETHDGIIGMTQQYLTTLFNTEGTIRHPEFLANDWQV